LKVPSTEVQNNFGKYVKFAEANEEIIVTRKGKAVARIVPCLPSEEATEYKTSDGWVTYEEFRELTEKSEQCFELIDGVIYFLTSPSYKHQHARDTAKSYCFPGLQVDLQEIFISLS